MMEYEIISNNSINYCIGNNNQVPLNTGELIRGLKSYGPYAKPTLRFNRIGIVYLNRYDWNRQIITLKNQILFKLKNIWHIYNVNISDFVYNSSDFSSIKEQVVKAIDENVDGIILILPGDMPSVYYKMKSYLINNIPSQFLRYDILMKSNLRFYVDGFLVQFISKLGGKPWILSIDPEEGTDIIIGTGATRIDNENLFCFAMVFKEDGTMLWNEVSPTVRINQYVEELKNIIQKAVIGFKSDNPDWNVKSLSLHISGKRPKIGKNSERDALEESIEELKNQGLISQSAKFSILHLEETHPFWIMGNPANRYHPDEGVKLKLSSKRYLLTISQPRPGKNSLPIKPLSIEIVSHN